MRFSRNLGSRRLHNIHGDLNYRTFRLVTQLRNSEGLDVHLVSRAARRQLVQFVAIFQDEGTHGVPTDMRLKGLQGLFEIAAEQGKQSLQG